MLLLDLCLHCSTSEFLLVWTGAGCESAEFAGDLAIIYV